MNIAHHICSFQAKLRSTFYIGPNCKHIFSSFPRHFVCSLMSRLTINMNCIEVSEVNREIFRYVTHKFIKLSFY